MRWLTMYFAQDF
jgi:hypothetical protein